MSDDALFALATKAGLEIDWADAAGEPHSVSPDTLRRVLDALGLVSASPRQILDSSAHLDEQRRKQPPLVTAWASEPFMAGNHVLTAQESPGYHAIEIDAAQTMVAVAPPRCFEMADLSDRRMAGLGVQLYALRGGHSAGFGDFAALADFSREAAKRGIDAIGVSPTHALFPSDHSHISPYSPSSRLFLNPHYADLALVGDTFVRDDGMEGLIDWPKAAAEKIAALRRAYQAYPAAGGSQAFHTFCADGGEPLLRHASFEVLDAQFRAQGLWRWRDWPEAYRDASSASVAQFAREHQDEVDYYRFLQFLAAKSASAAQSTAREAGMAIGLIADIATGVDPNGSDSWGVQKDFLMGLTIGAPPDPFNYAGQGWGLTAFSPTGLRDGGFASFIAMLRANMAHAGGIRIDHVMSLMRLWVIPEGAAPTEGVYLRYPMDDLMRLIALESHRHRTIVIGEDLGTVPHGFRNLLAHRGMDGMQVMWFEREWGPFTPPSRWRTNAVAMTTTHDLPTVAGWWRGRDIDWRTKLGMNPRGSDEASQQAARDADRALLWAALKHAGCAQGDPPPLENPEPVVDGALAYVGGTPSRLAIAPIEDVLALDEQPNLPGTTNEHPNWRRRLPAGDVFGKPGNGNRLARFLRARRSG
jgi:4-alpha-glucanotransferase